MFFFVMNTGPFDNMYWNYLLAPNDRKSMFIHAYICIGSYNLFKKLINGSNQGLLGRYSKPL
jgi:hypothetical protein